MHAGKERKVDMADMTDMAKYFCLLRVMSVHMVTVLFSSIRCLYHSFFYLLENDFPNSMLHFVSFSLLQGVRRVILIVNIDSA